MSRLTNKLKNGDYICGIIKGGFVDKLGKIEDLMEKHEIESVEDLEKILADYDDMAKAIVEIGLGVKVDFKEE